MKKLRILLLIFTLSIIGTFFSSSSAFSIEQVPINLVNGDFEEPLIEGTHPSFLDQLVVPGWNTTASDRKIEVWRRGNYENIIPYSGDQFVELMANMRSALYQDIDTKPGSYVYWEVAHRGRRGVDVAEVKFGKPGGNLVTQQVLRTGNNNWKKYSGYYKIPVGQTKTRFQFEGVSGTSDTIGNFLDGIKFTSEYRGSNIIVEYKDTEGNQLAISDSYKGPVGERYSVTSKDISGYTLVKTEGNLNGIYTDQDQKVTFIYDCAKGAPVNVRYVDESDEELVLSEILGDGKIGEAYRTTPKQILGCQLIETPSNANGIFQAHSQEVVYRYRRIITLTVPTSVFFGTYQIMRGNQEYPVKKIVGEPLQIIDGRKKGSKWQLYAKLQQPLINSSGKILSSGLSYQVGKEKKDITTNVYQIIQSHTTTKDREQINLSNNWNNTQGLFLKVNEGEAQVGTYQGVIEWILNDVPTN
ncbi:MucBP domain-containing protein [Enterococcus faecalis]|uniref:MucBP domain-containing protein n=1 Tax=Enterococcus faecalis TaxID=1351 RepID=UPI00138661FD|nr:MucBP domain-containing protein [Enterococcus faecalis]MEB7428317.1 MucBP domain-containing protein [Enterococcus faecalis]